jgi:hypothetical protein
MLLIFRFLCLVALWAVFGAGAYAQTNLEVRDVQNHPFAVQFPSGNRLRLHLRSGDFRIVGRNEDKLTVRLEGRNAGNAQDAGYCRKNRDASIPLGHLRNKVAKMVQAAPSMQMVAGTLMTIS